MKNMQKFRKGLQCSLNIDHKLSEFYASMSNNCNFFSYQGEFYTRW